MVDMDSWDFVLLAIAAIVAVSVLVRLMLARRDELITEVQQQINAEQQHKKANETESDT